MKLKQIAIINKLIKKMAKMKITKKKKKMIYKAKKMI